METLLLKYLSKGKTQNEIAAIFKKKNIMPNSLSSIEKALKEIKKNTTLKQCST